MNKLTVFQRKGRLENYTKQEVKYMSGQKYFIYINKKYQNIDILNEDIAPLGLKVESVAINDGGYLTFKLGEIIDA